MSLSPYAILIAFVAWLAQAGAGHHATVRIIVVGSADEAERVAGLLANGADFAVLARSLSTDPSAASGGLLGRVDVSALRPELRAALDGLVPGTVSPVARIPTGFAVLMVVPDVAERPVGAPAPGQLNQGIVATGGVKYMLSVDGLGEMIAALQAFPKPDDWNQDPRSICQTRQDAVADAIASMERALSPTSELRARWQPLDIVQGHHLLGELFAFKGQMSDAIAHFEQAREIAVTGVPAAIPQLEEALGILHLHRSTAANGVQDKPGDRCLLSPKGLAAWADTRDAQRAIEYFSTYLGRHPEELEVRWLLNLAYMATGGYPAAVPPALRIPPESFASSEDVGRFADVAPQAGLDLVGSAGGVIVDDFDGDGRYELVTSNSNGCGPMHYFRRDASGRFVNLAATNGLAAQLGGLNIMQADYNNDGCLDILSLRGAWMIPERKSLLRNNCDGTFTDVTETSGLARPATSTQAAVWTDVNNDGFVDLFVGNENRAAQLFLNKRDGTFEDVAARAGVDRPGYTKGVSAADVDNDGWPELYMSNFGGANALFYNNHDGTFTDVTQQAGVPGPGKGFATWFFDYDNDGWSDVFAASYFTSVEESARTYLKLPNNATTLKLYKNSRDGGFLDVTRQAGLDKVYMPMGSNFGDIDNDGFLDIYLGTGNPSYGSLTPSVLLRNRNGQSFVDVTSSSGTGELHKGHGVAFADMDNDGDDDIVFDVGGATPGDAHALRLFQNPGHGNDWIDVKLVGVKTNRAAIGARIHVKVAHADRRRSIHRTVGSGGSFGSSPLRQHIGLGKAAGPVDIEIWWPTSDTRQRFTAVPHNQAIVITEFGTDYTTLPRPPAPLSGSTTDATLQAQ